MIFKISSCFLALLLPIYSYAELSGLPKPKLPLESAWNTISDNVINNAKYSHMDVLTDDKKGTLYEGGTYFVDSKEPWIQCHWIVRKSIDEGRTWTIIDDYYLDQNSVQVPYESKIDQNGNLYIAGDVIRNIMHPEQPLLHDLRHFLGHLNNPEEHAVVRFSVDKGRSWQTVYPFSASPMSAAINMEITPDGALYVFGAYQENDKYFTGVVRSNDQGKTWTVIGKRELISDSLVEMPRCFRMDSQKNIYEFGEIWDNSLQKEITSYVKMSHDDGNTWTTLDTFKYDNTEFTRPCDALIDSEGNIYETLISSSVIGFPSHWLVRKCSKNSTWNTVDNYVTQNAYESNFPCTIALDDDGAVFVSGMVRDENIQVSWLIRTSNDKGAHWSIMDAFNYSSTTQFSSLEKIFLIFSKENSTKNVYAFGTITPETQNHWLTRKFSGIGMMNGK